jgi:prepilin-type N-terminal cleavage/methylation domain-containing protein/prepilin-type processing-associated H-X9-DG protein
MARRGFTLVELLVVIAIIGILTALLLPAVQSAREAGRRMQCGNNLKQIGLALHNYHSAHKALPFGSPMFYAGSSPTIPNAGTWALLLLPFLDSQVNYDQFSFTAPVSDPANASAVKQIISAYICPSDSSAEEAVLPSRNGSPGYHNPAVALGLWYMGSMGPTHMDSCWACADTIPSPSNPCCQGYSFGCASGYGMPAGTFAGVIARHPRSIRFAEIRDGLSHTIVVGETLPRQCSWNSAFAPNFSTTSTNIPLNWFESDSPLETSLPSTGLYFRSCGFKSRHGGVVQFAMCDGSVHFVTDQIEMSLLNQLGTRAGNETASLP